MVLGVRCGGLHQSWCSAQHLTGRLKNPKALRIVVICVAQSPWCIVHDVLASHCKIAGPATAILCQSGNFCPTFLDRIWCIRKALRVLDMFCLTTPPNVPDATKHQPVGISRNNRLCRSASATRMTVCQGSRSLPAETAACARLQHKQHREQPRAARHPQPPLKYQPWRHRIQAITTTPVASNRRDLTHRGLCDLPNATRIREHTLHPWLAVYSASQVHTTPDARWRSEG